MTMAPDGSNLSVVFQGPVAHRGADLMSALVEARHWLPKAEFILSTWIGQQGLEEHGFDQLVTSADPGPDYIDPVIGRPCNMTRQIYSTRAGLGAASRDYVMKIRTDFRIKERRFIDCWNGFKPALPKFNLFSKPVGIVALGTRNPVKMPMLFHPSDFVMVGAMTDVRNFWQAVGRTDQPLVTGMEKLLHPIYGPSFGRLAVEQELFLAYFRRASGLNFSLPLLDHTDPQSLFLSERYLLNSFCIFPPESPGAFAPPRLANNKMTYIGNYSAYDQQELAYLSWEDSLRRHRNVLAQRRSWWFSAFALYNWASIVALYFGPHAVVLLRLLHRVKKRTIERIA